MAHVVLNAEGKVVAWMPDDDLRPEPAALVANAPLVGCVSPPASEALISSVVDDLSRSCSEGVDRETSRARLKRQRPLARPDETPGPGCDADSNDS